MLKKKVIEYENFIRETYENKKIINDRVEAIKGRVAKLIEHFVDLYEGKQTEEIMNFYEKIKKIS